MVGWSIMVDMSDITLSKTYRGRYTILGVPELSNCTGWVYKDGDEWHVMRTEPASLKSRWIATGKTRAEALELAESFGWK